MVSSLPRPLFSFGRFCQFRPLLLPPCPPLAFRLFGSFKSFKTELQIHKIISTDENASRKSKDEKCSIVMHSFCSELEKCATSSPIGTKEKMCN